MYNYGQALMKVQKFEEAFKCFDKVTSLLKHSPRLWYYMAICSIYHSRELKQKASEQINEQTTFKHIIASMEIKYQRQT